MDGPQHTELVIWAGDTLVPQEGPNFKMRVRGYPGQTMGTRGPFLTFGGRTNSELCVLSVAVTEWWDELDFQKILLRTT